MSKNITAVVSSEPIDCNYWMSRPVDPVCGAQVVFTGIVRNLNHGKKVVQVSYDSFEPLAQKTFVTIAQEAMAKWGSQLYFNVVHRIGDLKVGEISVIIVVNSKHRDEAYLASRYFIEEMKTRAPIWKKETYENGETEWLRGHALCGHESRSAEL